MSEVRYILVAEQDVGQRLDNFLFRILKGVPKSHIYRIIRGGEVRVNKKRAQVSTKLILGDNVRIPPVRVSAPDASSVVPKHVGDKLLTNILYEDDRFLVINKPAGLAVHGGSGISLGIIESLRALRQDIHYLELVHRLDRDTSGCLLMAKKRSALRSLQALFAAREVTKTYWALLEGSWQGQKFQTVEAPLQKNILKSGERMVVVNPSGKAAVTDFHIVENYSEACWVEAFPHTGRTHQIRVHSAYLAHPIIGDEKYNQHERVSGMQQLNKRLYLHARSIQFTLEETKFSFEAEVDDMFQSAIAKLRKSIS